MEAGTLQKVTKVAEADCVQSAFDLIIKGQRAGITVLYEDEQCVVFNDIKPVAAAHFIVLSKQKSKIEDAGHMGHLMYVVSQVAKKLNLLEGYRVVVNQTETQRNV